MKLPALPLAIALWAALGLAAATAVAQESTGRDWQSAVASTIERGAEILHAGYQRSPTLVLTFSALLVLPAVAVVSLMARRTARARSRRRAYFAALAASAPWTRGTRPGQDVPAWPAQAWLSIEGEATGAHPLADDVVRIGRHEENDIRLPHASVHRYHAVIHRTEEADFVITDLSGEAGNGVRVNGERRTQSRLVDGDLIELGKARMTFASVPV